MDAEEGFKGGALAEADHLEKYCNKDFKERGKWKPCFQNLQESSYWLIDGLWPAENKAGFCVFMCQTAYGWIFLRTIENKSKGKINNKITEDQIKLISVSQNKLTSIFWDVDWMSPEQKNKTKN